MTPRISTQAGQAFALLLRGEAFRGSPDLATYKEPHANEAERRRSQIECSDSLQREVIQPLVDARFRVDVFLAVYTDLNASNVHALTAAYAAHVVHIVRLLREQSRQNLVTRAILDDLLEYAARTGTSYEAIILTRFDLYWKPRALRGDDDAASDDGAAIDNTNSDAHEANAPEALSVSEVEEAARTRSVARLLNARRSFVFLFRERHGHWRDATHAPPVHGSERVSGSYYSPQRWRTDRATVADVFIGFPFALAPCFRAVLQLIMSKDWRTNSAAALLQKGAKDTGTHLHDLAKLLAHVKPVVLTNASTAAAAATATAAATRAPLVDFIYRTSAFASNPCQSQCMSNPAYEILPRGRWLLSSRICQRRQDFLTDPKSGTMCCPTPECARKRARLLLCFLSHKYLALSISLARPIDGFRLLPELAAKLLQAQRDPLRPRAHTAH